MSDSILSASILGVFKTIATVYDIISLPVYAIIQQPWVKRRTKSKVRAQPEDSNDPYSAWVRVGKPPDHPILQKDTVDALFSFTVKQHGDRQCLGFRQLLGEEDEKQPDGKIFKKFIQDDKFTWFTYSEADEKILNISRGLHSIGVKRGDSLMIFAETQIEWFLSAMAAFRIGASIATLYANLGLEALVHSINETEVSHLITTYDLLPKIKTIQSSLPQLRCIIYIEGPNKSVDKTNWDNIELISLEQVELKGNQSKEVIEKVVVKPEDTAVIMYTSGSTGIPKGVIITHKNLMATVRGFYAVAHSLDTNERYLAYLPLAHVLELAAECFFLSKAIPIGYSSPHTMTDRSTAIKKGCPGDCTLLRPTVMAAVPLVLDRIKKAISENLDSQTPLMKGVFTFAMQYKQFWSSWGFRTPLINHILCKKIKKVLGGQIKIIVSGSAPLAIDTHEFIRNVLDVTLISGYGLTETAAGATIMDFDDYSVGRAGAPLYGVRIKLSDWEEGNYHATDKPNPRGEIIIGGDCVTAGYFCNELLTQEFYKNDSIRWFSSGDIGEIYPDGTIKLIDRKKDLVKLQYGEYISLGKVETELKTCPIVDNICVYGDSLHDYLIVIVVPNEKVLRGVARQLNLEHLGLSQLCKNSAVLDVVKKMFYERATKVKLSKMERPAKILLVEEEWTPESGLVTAALKIRRKNIQDRYMNEINRLYKTGANGVQSA